MAMLNESFDVNNLPQGDGGNFDPLPAGWYTAQITQSSLETTKAGTGQYIKVRYDILGPTHQGRVVFGNLNISNPNPKAEEIGRQQLGDLMRAIGLSQVRDTDQLIGGECSIKLAIQKSEQYGDSNEVKAWKALDGGGMQRPAQSQPQQAAPSQGAGPTPPWMQN